MRHVPVLLNEVIESLQLKPGVNVIDCTLGDGGHAEAMLEKTAPTGRLLGIDADPESIVRAKNYLYRFGDRIQFVRDNFVNLGAIAMAAQFAPVQAVLMDLGWSRPQFEERGRGFSFLRSEEPLDMRYTPQGTAPSASDLVNTFNTEELERIFHDYGEEELSQEISSAIVSERSLKKIATVGELVNLVLVVYRKKLKTDKDVPWIGGLHPATKVFQALRMAVNHELDYLERTLPQAIDLMDAGARLAVITFHSIEDRIVKHYFKSLDGKTLVLINKKPIVCHPEEWRENPSARSAKLRVIQKL